MRGFVSFKPAVRGLAVLACLGPLAAAQANQDPGVNVFLADLDAMDALGRKGAYPNGVNGVSVMTTICNIGNKPLPWMSAMNPNHPVIGFLVVRQSNGRFEQISDRSFVKHGFFAMGGNVCGNCIVPTTGALGTLLGIGCSDIYDGATNGMRFVLGPAEEINPWTGAWTRRCGYFDRGDPAVPAPKNCDGKRSLTLTQAANLGPVANRILIADGDLNVAGATFFGQAQYVIKGEPETVRGDSIGSRQFTPSWNGFKWSFTRVGNVKYGTVLHRWAGASVTSGVNDDGSGATDGRVYVAVKVTGPDHGLYHYEYAVHNRDNQRGVGSFRIPVCSGARVFDMGFSDIDADPANDWTTTMDASGVAFSTLSDPLRWNTIYNFWFDSDAAPVAADIELEAFDPAAASSTFGFSAMSPGALHNVYLGPGCSNGVPSELYATGSPAQALLGNDAFALESINNVPGMPNLLLGSFSSGTTGFFGCTLWFSGLGLPFSSVNADPNGVAYHAVPIPSAPAIEGLRVRFQSLGVNPGQGALFGIFDLSSGLEVRVGDTIPDCP